MSSSTVKTRDHKRSHEQSAGDYHDGYGSGMTITGHKRTCRKHTDELMDLLAHSGPVVFWMFVTPTSDVHERKMKDVSRYLYGAPPTLVHVCGPGVTIRRSEISLGAGAYVEASVVPVCDKHQNNSSSTRTCTSALCIARDAVVNVPVVMRSRTGSTVPLNMRHTMHRGTLIPIDLDAVRQYGLYIASAMSADVSVRTSAAPGVPDLHSKATPFTALTVIGNDDNSSSSGSDSDSDIDELDRLDARASAVTSPPPTCTMELKTVINLDIPKTMWHLGEVANAVRQFCNEHLEGITGVSIIVENYVNAIDDINRCVT